jgi:carboxyl-terminal processing protease
VKTSTGRRAGIVVALALVLAQGLRPGAADALDQGARLSALVKVWGLLKYFHAGVAEGTVNWHLALVDELPLIQAAQSKAEFNDEIVRLVRSVGSPRLAAGADLDRPETDPAFQWLDDDRLFDPLTIRELKTVRNAVVSGNNRYVRGVTGVGNPDFGRESAYDLPAYPSVGMRFLALARFWNMVQYYAPNRDVTDRPWSDVLPLLLPHFLEAADGNAYHLAACELTASLDDAHAFTTSSTLSLAWGLNSPPIRTRYIESETVVTDVFDTLSRGADVRPGDIVIDINGVKTADIRSRLHGSTWGSNEGSRQRNIDTLVLRTNSNTVTLGISRFGVRKEVGMTAYAIADVSAEAARIDALPPKWRVLDGNIGYVHMGRLLTSDVPAMIAGLPNTAAIVFDVRNYPNGTMYDIANWLNPAGRPFVTFTRPLFEKPGTMQLETWIDAGPTSPNPNHYPGEGDPARGRADAEPRRVHDDGAAHRA